MISREKKWIVGICLSAATITGCVERKESITIFPDGTVRMVLEFKAEELQLKDAVPLEKTGWIVRREIRKKKKGDGNEEVVLTAERTFKPGEDLPKSYADPDDPDARVALGFPTSLCRETRKDGDYFIFRRSYTSRPWAYIKIWEDQVMDDNIKKIAEKPVEQQTHDEKMQLIQAFAMIEAFRQAELTAEAAQATGVELLPETTLLARRALLKVYGEQTDWESLVAEAEAQPAEVRDAHFHRESLQLIDRAREAFVSALGKDGKFDASARQRFESALRRAIKRYEVSNELATHAFKIEVAMPGEIVAHNSDAEGEDSTVRWEFTGEAFRDRTQELVVVSKVSGTSRR